jgi:hypothetical protein
MQLFTFQQLASNLLCVLLPFSSIPPNFITNFLNEVNGTCPNRECSRRLCLGQSGPFGSSRIATISGIWRPWGNSHQSPWQFLWLHPGGNIRHWSNSFGQWMQTIPCLLPFPLHLLYFISSFSRLQPQLGLHMAPSHIQKWSAMWQKHVHDINVPSLVRNKSI